MKGYGGSRIQLGLMNEFKAKRVESMATNAAVKLRFVQHCSSARLNWKSIILIGN